MNSKRAKRTRKTAMTRQTGTPKRTNNTEGNDMQGGENAQAPAQTAGNTGVPGDTESVLAKSTTPEPPVRHGDRRDELNPVDRMGREQRVPIGKQNRVKFAQRPGYVRRMVNDIEDGERVKMFEKAGYRIVREKTSGGDSRAGAETQIGTAVSRSVGGGMRGVLMEIPQELYDADQAEKQREIDETEKELKRKPGFYGETKIER